MTEKKDEIARLEDEAKVWDEKLREALQKQAEAKGEEFDPASVTEPRIIWSDFLGSTPRRIETSMVSSNRAVDVSLRRSSASSIG